MSTDDIFIISTVALFVLLFVVAIVSEIMSAGATDEPNDYSDIDDDELRKNLSNSTRKKRGCRSVQKLSMLPTTWH